jgi:hypothetical protein
MIMMATPSRRKPWKAGTTSRHSEHIQSCINSSSRRAWNRSCRSWKMSAPPRSNSISEVKTLGYSPPPGPTSPECGWESYPDFQNPWHCGPVLNWQVFTHALVVRSPRAGHTGHELDEDLASEPFYLFCNTLTWPVRFQLHTYGATRHQITGTYQSQEARLLGAARSGRLVHRTCLSPLQVLPSLCHQHQQFEDSGYYRSVPSTCQDATPLHCRSYHPDNPAHIAHRPVCKHCLWTTWSAGPASQYMRGGQESWACASLRVAPPPPRVPTPLAGPNAHLGLNRTPRTPMSPPLFDLYKQIWNTTRFSARPQTPTSGIPVQRNLMQDLEQATSHAQPDGWCPYRETPFLQHAQSSVHAQSEPHGHLHPRSWPLCHSQLLHARGQWSNASRYRQPWQAHTRPMDAWYTTNQVVAGSGQIRSDVHQTWACRAPQGCTQRAL